MWRSASQKLNQRQHNSQSTSAHISAPRTNHQWSHLRSCNKRQASTTRKERWMWRSASLALRHCPPLASSAMRKHAIPEGRRRHQPVGLELPARPHSERRHQSI